MGGSGSGRRYYSKQTTSSYHQFDVRSWQREGHLVQFGSFMCGYWKVDVALAMRRFDHEWVILTRIDPLSEPCPIRLVWTPCNYGGRRPWLLCPTKGCGRRVAILYGILYGNGSIACRHCRELAYDSQQESEKHRALHAAQKIRVRLGGSCSLADPFPPKPKGMHWRTYRRLFSNAEQREAAFFGSLALFVERLDNLAMRFERKRG